MNWRDCPERFAASLPPGGLAQEEYLIEKQFDQKSSNLEVQGSEKS